MSDKGEWENWLVDTGASCHVTSSARYIQNADMNSNAIVVMGDKRKCAVTAKGTLTLKPFNGARSLHIHKVRVVETIGKNILSVGLLLQDGGKIEGEDDTLYVTYGGVHLTFHKNQNDRLYYMKMKRIENGEMYNCYAVGPPGIGWTKVEERNKWSRMARDEAHQKWGHPHYDQLNKMGIKYRVNLYGHNKKPGSP